MIADSPDWFSGFSSFDPRDAVSNTWYDSFTIETFPWDAGTETGDAYSLNNDAENPHQPVFQLTQDTVPLTTRVLLNPLGTEVLPVARWDCELVADIDGCPASDECDRFIGIFSGFTMHKDRLGGRFCSDWCIPEALLRTSRTFGWNCGECN
jgi:hypothetical protein